MKTEDVSEGYLWPRSTQLLTPKDHRPFGKGPDGTMQGLCPRLR